MPESGKAERFAIEAVAKHFSAAWQAGEGPPDAYLKIAGRRIALDIAVMPQQPLERNRVLKVRLREDVVARRVLRDLESALSEQVPDGKTVILTLGAPIRVPKKLLPALTHMLLTRLESGVEEAEEKKTILGNRVRFCILNDNSIWNSKAIGFVFSGDPKPGALAKAMRSLHDAIDAGEKKRLPERFAGDRWLVLVDNHWIGDVKTWRRIYSLLAKPGGFPFKKIMMVLDNGRVESLAEA